MRERRAFPNARGGRDCTITRSSYLLSRFGAREDPSSILRAPDDETRRTERERFTDSPFERYRKPQAQIKLQSVDPLPRIDGTRKKSPRGKLR